MWTAGITSQQYVAGELQVVATVASDNGGANFTVSRTIAPGTVSAPEALVALVNEFAQSAADRMNAFDTNIVQPALAELQPQIDANVQALQTGQALGVGIKIAPALKVG